MTASLRKWKKTEFVEDTISNDDFMSDNLTFIYEPRHIESSPSGAITSSHSTLNNMLTLNQITAENILEGKICLFWLQIGWLITERELEVRSLGSDCSKFESECLVEV